MSKIICSFLAVAIGVTAPSFIAQAAESGANSSARALSLRLNWKMKGEFAPFIVADKKGFFKKEGLNVKVNEGTSATQALQTVASGQDDIAYVPSVQLIKAIGEGLPVKAIATVVKVDSMGMVASSKFKLSSPRDLEGRVVEISPDSTFNQIWEAFARKNNIDVSKVNVVRAAPSARFGLLLSGKVDILADIFMTTEYPVLQLKSKEKLNTLSVADWGFPLLGYTLVASTKLQGSSADMLKRFNKAAMEGFKYTMEHPDEAAAIAAAAYPEALPLDTTKGQVAQLVSFLKRGEPKQMFAGNDESWNRTVDILKTTGVISEKKPVATYYTNAFLPGGS